MCFDAEIQVEPWSDKTAFVFIEESYIELSSLSKKEKAVLPLRP